MHIRHDPVDTISIFLKFFIAKFVVNNQVNNKRGADANGKTGNVDHGKNPGSPEIPKRNKEVILDHKATSTSKFSTLVPITELAGKQGFSHNFLLQVSENGQYTYIFVHVNIGHYKIQKSRLVVYYRNGLYRSPGAVKAIGSS